MNCHTLEHDLNQDVRRTYSSCIETYVSRNYYGAISKITKLKIITDTMSGLQYNKLILVIFDNKLIIKFA